MQLFFLQVWLLRCNHFSCVIIRSAWSVGEVAWGSSKRCEAMLGQAALGRMHGAWERHGGPFELHVGCL